MSVVLRKVDYVTAPQSYWFFLEQIIPTFQLQLICLRNQKGHSLEMQQGITKLLVCGSLPCRNQKDARCQPVCFVKHTQEKQPKWERGRILLNQVSIVLFNRKPCTRLCLKRFSKGDRGERA